MFILERLEQALNSMHNQYSFSKEFFHCMKNDSETKWTWKYSWWQMMILGCQDVFSVICLNVEEQSKTYWHNTIALSNKVTMNSSNQQWSTLISLFLTAEATPSPLTSWFKTWRLRLALKTFRLKILWPRQWVLTKAFSKTSIWTAIPQQKRKTGRAIRDSYKY